MRKELGRGFNTLLHATITHSDKDCPLYNRGTILPVVDALKKRDDLAQKHGITLYWMVSGAPEHVSYALLESEYIDKSHSFARSVRNTFNLQNHAGPNDERRHPCLESMSADDVRLEASTVHQTMIVQMGTPLPRE